MQSDISWSPNCKIIFFKWVVTLRTGLLCHMFLQVHVLTTLNMNLCITQVLSMNVCVKPMVSLFLRPVTGPET